MSPTRSYRLPVCFAVLFFIVSTAHGQTPAANPGAKVYAANCVACHQENGQGVTGAFPPLAGHTANLLVQAGGRAYLIRVLLFGVEGAISVNGASYAGTMPAWAALDDNAIAGVLNHVVSAWDKPAANFKPFDAAEIAALRTERLSAAAVYALRQKVIPLAKEAAAPTAAIPVSFTELQVTQGRAVYAQNCMDCHGSTLDNGEFGGAPLKGSYFRNRWSNGNVASLYAYLKSKMPPDRPGVLSDKVYAEVLAYLLQANGYEAGGRELPTDVSVQQSTSLKRD